MQQLIRLASADDLAVDDLRIVERAPSWTAPQPTPGHRLVFVRRGTFGLRLRGRGLRGWEVTVDPVSAFVGRPGDEQSIAHRPGREDACTVISFGPRLAADLLPEPAPGALRTSGRVDMAHRALLARARQGADGFELAERVVRLAEDLFLDPVRVVPTGAGSPAHRRLAGTARDVLVADPAFSGLDRLARQLGVTRSHLSRVFRAETGETLTRFRYRLRVRAALDRLAGGDRDLAGLAADLGFADHAHLTRAMRAEVGDPPSRVRSLLAGEHESSSRRPRRRGRSRNDHPNLERTHIR